MAGPPDTLALAHRLKQQIDSLTEQQTEALRRATYLGMTPEEAQEYDQRRKQITLLVQELAEFEGALGISKRPNMSLWQEASE